MKYLYETHLHTCQVSACALSRGRDYIAAYKAFGYTGIIVTDHFFNGNSRLPQDLPWKEWVHRFCRGYEEAWEAGKKQALDVFFGWEETFDGDDYLVYGLDKQWLLEHPEAAHWNRREQYETVKFYGGCVVQAHPFRQHYYIDTIHLAPTCVDAVEVANASNEEASYDALAMKYAQALGLPITAGTDIHYVEYLQGLEIPFGVYLNKKMDGIEDYVMAIGEKTLGDLQMSPGRCDFHGNETVRLPVDIRDKADLSTGRDLWDLLGCRSIQRKEESRSPRPGEVSQKIYYP
ncbi:MAG: PHP domain-containing protein [Treponema sp.]|jgi:histidinol phosphatase-like PHP family hydrolase|nr:PHP domain-containing protein [Treponema sp.]